MREPVSFGAWLRQRRRALDLTQAALAQRVGCATGTIRKLESDERRPSLQLASVLAAHLAVPAPERAAVVQVARGEWPPDRLTMATASSTARPGRPPLRSVHGLPVPRDPLIGRDAERTAVGRLLLADEVGLVTLTGPGGAGKTRLALQVAADVAGAFRDGVVYVALEALVDPALVLATIAQALAVRERSDQALEVTLQAALRDQHVLLVLDNFEHLRAAVVPVAALLQAAPGLTVLVTSRAPLQVSAEQQFPVPPLTLPDARHADVATQVAQSEAGALFLARARALRPALDGAAHAASIAAICHRLDGLPLAIELAAARTIVLSPPELLRRLEQSLALLTGGRRDQPARQQTMRATIDWSYALLTAPEQALFRRLGVFVGGFTLAAADAVCGRDGGAAGDLPTVDGLQRLIDTSLVQQRAEVNSEPRFVLLETVREYALERLAASAEAAALQRQHVGYFLALAEAEPAEKHLPRWWDRLEQEHANLRAALAWSRAEAGGETGLRLVVALASFWRGRGHLREGHRWMVAAVTPPGGELAAARAETYWAWRAQALDWLGVFTTFIGDPNGAQRWLDESLTLFRELGDDAGIAEVLGDRGMVFQQQGDFVRAGVDLHESLRLYRKLEGGCSVGLGLHSLGTLAYAEGDVQQAVARWEESLTILRAEDARWATATVLTHLAMVALDQGDDERAGIYLTASITHFQQQDERWSAILALEVCARWVAQRGQRAADARVEWLRAARLFGAAEAVRETLGAPRLELFGAHYRRAVTGLRNHLDETACAAAWAEGRALTLEQALAYALEDLPVPSTSEG